MSQSKPDDLSSLLTFDAFRLWLSSQPDDMQFCDGEYATSSCLIAKFAQSATGKSAWAAVGYDGFVAVHDESSHHAPWIEPVIRAFDNWRYNTFKAKPTVAQVRAQFPQWFL